MATPASATADVLQDTGFSGAMWEAPQLIPSFLRKCLFLTAPSRPNLKASEADVHEGSPPQGSRGHALYAVSRAEAWTAASRALPHTCEAKVVAVLWSGP